MTKRMKGISALKKRLLEIDDEVRWRWRVMSPRQARKFKRERVQICNKVFSFLLKKVKYRNSSGESLVARFEKGRVRQERMQYIFNLRMQGKTLREIGNCLGISHERVRQIGVSLPDDKRELFIKGCKPKKDHKKYTYICDLCGETFDVPVERKSKRTFCSFICFKKSISNIEYPPEIKSGTQRKKYRYQNDPAYRLFTRNRYKRWKDNRESLNPKLREKRLKTMRRYSKKRKSTNNL